MENIKNFIDFSLYEAKTVAKKDKDKDYLFFNGNKLEFIEKGKVTSWPKECICTGNGDNGCGAKLLVDSSDVSKSLKEACWPDGCTIYYETYNTFVCPECNVKTEIFIHLNN